MIAGIPAVAKTSHRNPAHNGNYSNSSTENATSNGERPLIVQHGIASWYGPGFEGRRAADGQIFHSSHMTAAHRWLPLDTRIRVTNLESGKSVEVRVNDRGPYVKKRVLDLSKAAAEKLEMKKDGVAPVRIEVFPKDQPDQRTREAVLTKTDTARSHGAQVAELHE